MSQFSELFSSWNLIRLSGFLAFFYMTMSVCFGMLFSIKSIKANKNLFHHLHLTSGWIGFLTIAFHSVVVWKNEYIPYSIAEIVIPFISEHEPIWSGLGTLSLSLFFIILFTTDFGMKAMKRSVWRGIHLLVYPAWMFMLLHGIFIGTSSTMSWAAVIYGGSLILIVFLFGLKINELFIAKKIKVEKNET